MKEPAHLALNPFGQIPTYEEGDLASVRDGIDHHLASPRAIPASCQTTPTRGRGPITWMFAAVSTVEPPILELLSAKLLEADKPWTKERRRSVADRVRDRLKQLSAYLGDADWLDGDFSAGDLDDGACAAAAEAVGPLGEYPPIWRPMSPAPRRGPPSGGPSPTSWRSSPASWPDLRGSAGTISNTWRPGLTAASDGLTLRARSRVAPRCGAQGAERLKQCGCGQGS